MEELPGNLVVIGGGYIGTELGSAYANFGSEVTILKAAMIFLAGFEKQMTHLLKKLEEKRCRNCYKSIG